MDGSKNICFQVVGKERQAICDDPPVVHFSLHESLDIFVEMALREVNLENIQKAQIRVWKPKNIIKLDVVDFDAIISSQADRLRRSTELLHYWDGDLGFPCNCVHVVVGVAKRYGMIDSLDLPNWPYQKRRKVGR